MPMFDYKCTKCGSRKNNEIVMKWDDKVVCEECGEDMLKLLSAPQRPHIASGSTVGPYVQEVQELFNEKAKECAEKGNAGALLETTRRMREEKKLG